MAKHMRDTARDGVILRERLRAAADVVECAQMLQRVMARARELTATCARGSVTPRLGKQRWRASATTCGAAGSVVKMAGVRSV